jgi:hypothetical protein
MKLVLVSLAVAFAAFATTTDSAPNISVPQQGSDAFFDPVGTIEAETYAGNAYSVGCGWDGTYVWVTNGAGQAGQPTGVFLLFEEDGTFVEQFNQNTAPGWGLRDLCCDGTYMYGSVSTAIDYYDISTHEKEGCFYGPQNPNRALAYDGTSTTWSTAATSVYGAAWDPIGNCMWVTSADASGIVAQIDDTGALITTYTPVAGGTYGGATMGSTSPINMLWIFNQGTPDQVLAYDVSTALDRDTWGSIKSLF